MSRILQPTAKRTLVTGLAAVAVSIASIVAGTGNGAASAAATSPPAVNAPFVQPAVVTVPFVGRVLDGTGRAQRAAALVACPYVGSATTADCSQPIRQPVGPAGVAVLMLNTSVRYQVLAAVKNPTPPWPCPGLQYGNDMLYLSVETLVGTPQQLPHAARFTIVTPTAANCVTVRVTDDAGTPIPHAGLFIDAGYSNGQTGADGTIRLQVTPGTTYDMGAFVAGTGWPCPSWVNPVDGTQLHMATRRPVTAEELIAGVTFVIHHPDASECAPVAKADIRMVDESGQPLPAAFISTCGYDPAAPPTYPLTADSCSADSGWRGPDGDGVIRVPVADPSLTYDITGFLSCTDGWYLFGEFNNSSNGYTHWTISGADLLADGLELTILGDVATCLAPQP